MVVDVKYYNEKRKLTSLNDILRNLNVGTEQQRNTPRPPPLNFKYPKLKYMRITSPAQKNINKVKIKKKEIENDINNNNVNNVCNSDDEYNTTNQSDYSNIYLLWH